MEEFFHIHAEQIRGFTAMMNLLNITMIFLWIWLFYRNVRLRRDYKSLEPAIAKNWQEIKRSNDLLELHAPKTPTGKVYLVWLIGSDQDEKPINALVGCCRSEEAAHEYAGNKVHHVQEIEVI